MDRSSSDEKKSPDDGEERTLTPAVLQEAAQRRTSVVTKGGDVVNASGHRDVLQRQYGLLSICGLALTIDNAWVALGGSLTISICKA